MSFLSQLFAKRSSAPVARDRLQILLAHERAEGAAGGEGQGELIARLREEILEVIARHVPIDRDKVQIKLDRGAGVSTLEIDVEMPVGKKAGNGMAKPAPEPVSKPLSKDAQKPAPAAATKPDQEKAADTAAKPTADAAGGTVGEKAAPAVDP